jgi:D-inositol-3-phosphate glycosyltransferase
MSQRYKIALVNHGAFGRGGVSSLCWFLYQTICSTECYEVQLFSIEDIYDSPNNVRLLSPSSWKQGLQITDYFWNNLQVKHVGARFSEFEFQRYMPRRLLTELLNEFDLLQVVAGSPAAANVMKDINKPICLSIATLARLERKSILQRSSLRRRVYGQIMLPIVSEIEKQVLKRADHVFADTEYTRQAILPYTDKSKISIDTIGVDTRMFHPLAEKQRKNDYFLSVGRFEDERKNVALLFDAYALLRQRMPDVPKLVLAGATAPNKAAWSKAHALGIAANIVFKKDVAIEDLVALYQNAAVFVLSSDEEGLGIVLLEAMACATPVISTLCGGPDTVVSKENGFLIPVGDAQAMADRMLWLLQHPEEQRLMGQAGRRMVESRFSNEVIRKKYLDVYDKLLKRAIP